MDLHFNFGEYEQAFEAFYRHKKDNIATCLVISSHKETQGFYIEHYDPIHRCKCCPCYRSVKAVKGLENVIKNTLTHIDTQLLKATYTV